MTIWSTKKGAWKYFFSYNAEPAKHWYSVDTCILNLLGNNIDILGKQTFQKVIYLYIFGSNAYIYIYFQNIPHLLACWDDLSSSKHFCGRGKINIAKSEEKLWAKGTFTSTVLLQKWAAKCAFVLILITMSLKTTLTGEKNTHPCSETNWHSNQHK